MSVSKPSADDSSICKLCLAYCLRTLATNLKEESLNVARRLGLQPQSISWIAHTSTIWIVEKGLSNCFCSERIYFVEHLALRDEKREDLVDKLLGTQCINEDNRNETEETECCLAHCAGKCNIL